MRKSRYKEEQIIGTVKEYEAGLRVSDISRKYGISEHTFYRWKSKYGGKLGQNLVKKGYISESELMHFLSRQLSRTVSEK